MNFYDFIFSQIHNFKWFLNQLVDTSDCQQFDSKQIYHYEHNNCCCDYLKIKINVCAYLHRNTAFS